MTLTLCLECDFMGLVTNLTSQQYADILGSFTLKFPRKYGAERLRKGFPSLRKVFDQIHEETKGKPPTPLLFANRVWEACEEIPDTLREDVEARARRAHPSFCREVHLHLMLNERFGESAEVKSSAELDMEYKTDFLIVSPVEPVAIRLHTYTDTPRSHIWINRRKGKKSRFTLNDQIREQAAGLPSNDNERHEVDVRLTLNAESSDTLDNGFWLYTADHVEEVVREFENLHN